MLIIGLSAKKQGGKNTAATHIAEAFGRNLCVREYSYADYLKRMCIDLFGLTKEQCYGTDEQKNSPTQLRWRDFWFLLAEDMKNQHRFVDLMTGREVLQVMGTDVIRRIYGNAWVDATIRSIKRSEADIALITDVRFPNEVYGAQAAGGKVIRLLRAPCTQDQHSSETALDDFPLKEFDAVLDNREMTIEQQRQPIVALVTQWL